MSIISWNDIFDYTASWENMTYYSDPTIMTLLITLILILTVSSEVRGFQAYLRKIVTGNGRSISFTDNTEQQQKLPRASDWWDGLMPSPFAVDTSLSGEEAKMEIVSVDNPDVTHFCFLVHGHRGRAKDLSYLQDTMQSLVDQEKRKQTDDGEVEPVGEDDSPTTKAATTTSSPAASPNSGIRNGSTSSLRHDMVVHSATCNEKKTEDGVTNGGERLVEEMMQVIRDEMEKRHPSDETDTIYDVTISVVGNSLGGIYSRYAIAKLAELSEKMEDGTWILDKKYRLHFNVFCTTATPHLGISKHTYVPLPRTAEIGVAHALGTTGHDLFRLNDLMKTMATSPKFLDPLGAFRKRIAYANAFRTDSAVPTETAAFLNHNSSYPHHFSLEEEDDVDGEGETTNEEEDGEDDDGIDRLVVDDNGLIIAVLHTPQTRNAGDEHHSQHHHHHDEPLSLDEEHAAELVQMSSALDSLGWKKVFVDIRKEIPLRVPVPSLDVSIPRMMRRISTGSGAEGGGEASSSLSVVEETTAAEPEPLHVLRQKGVVESRDIVHAMTKPSDKRLSLPIGHNMICAFSRSRISTFINKGGRPVVDSLAKELVDDIFTWNRQEKE